MNRRLMALASLALFAALPIAAQGAPEMTKEEVLALHRESIGGEAAWTEWKTARMTGTMTMAGGQMEAPFTMYFRNGNPGQSRLEFTFQGMTGIQAFDGETAWAIMPFMGKTDPEKMPPDQAKLMKENADLAGPLVNSEEKDVEIEYLGGEAVEGTDAHKLEVTLESGDVRYYYLDAEYGLALKVHAKTTMQGREIETETILGDYKEIGGRVVPHSIESKPVGSPGGQTILMESVEFDVELPDGLFAMPDPAAEAAEGGG